MSRIADIAKILVDKNGLKQAEAENFVRQMFDVTAAGLDEDKLVKIKGLGTFKVTKTKDRESINVNTGERIVIEGREKINFAPDNVLKEIVNRPFAQFETVVVNDGVEFDDIDKKYDIETSVEVGSDPKKAYGRHAEVVTTVHELRDLPENEEEIEEIVSATEKPDRVTTIPDQPEMDNSQAPVQSSQSIKNEVEPVVEPVRKIVTLSEIQAEDDDQEDLIEESLEQMGPSAQKIVNGSAEETEENPNVEVINNGRGPEKWGPLPSYKTDDDDENIEDNNDDELEEDDDESRFVSMPRYFTWIAGGVVAVLLLGMGYVGYNYSKVAEERDNLQAQLERNKTNSAQTHINRKAEEDHERMMQVSNAVDKAEKAKQEAAKANELVNDEAVNTKKEESNSSNKVAESKEQETSSKYDSDPRIKYGAYRIVGVERTIKAKQGQTISSISKSILGPGMECYLEALNGNGPLKEGQDVKIPKLKWKKKK